MPKSKPAKSEGKPAPIKKVALKQASTGTKPASAKAKPARVKAKTAPATAKAIPAKAKTSEPTPSKAKSSPAKASSTKAKTEPAKATAVFVKAKSTTAKAKQQSSSGSKTTPVKVGKAATKPVSIKGASMASSKKADTAPKSKSVSKAVPAPKIESTPPASQKATPAPKAPAIKSAEKAQKASLEEKKLLADALVKKKILPPEKKKVTDEWVLQQRERIYELRDNLVESMHGVAKDTLRSRAEGSEASAFGMHQADAGSDSYDRDFALSLLSQEQDALYEIDEALKRIEFGTYGVCEMSGKVIKRERLEALPFARYTVECQAEVERQKKLHKARMPVTSLFGLTEEEGAESEEEDQTLDAKD